MNFFITGRFWQITGKVLATSLCFASQNFNLLACILKQVSTKIKEAASLYKQASGI